MNKDHLNKNQLQFFYNLQYDFKILNEIKLFFSPEFNENPFIFLFDNSYGPSLILSFKYELINRSQIFSHFNSFIKKNPSQDINYLELKIEKFVPNNTVQFLELDVFADRFNHQSIILKSKLPHSLFLLDYYLNPLDKNLKIPFYLHFFTICFFHIKDNTLNLLNKLKITTIQTLFDKKSNLKNYSIEVGEVFYLKNKKLLLEKNGLILFVNYIKQIIEEINENNLSEFNWLVILNNTFFNSITESIEATIDYYSMHIKLEPEIKLQIIMAIECVFCE